MKSSIKSIELSYQICDVGLARISEDYSSTKSSANIFFVAKGSFLIVSFWFSSGYSSLKCSMGLFCSCFGAIVLSSVSDCELYSYISYSELLDESFVSSMSINLSGGHKGGME